MNSQYLKRLLDIVFTVILLCLTWPLFCLAFLLTFLDGHKNPLFLQKRLGLHCREFTIYKFRTMKSSLHASTVTHVKPDAPELTSIARFMRRTSLDELPQLVNILKGDMSLIGPRPHALEYAEHYASIHPEYYQRYAVRPGLACIVEVTVLHYMAETSRHIKARINSDLYYVRHRSFRLDLKIFMKMVRCVLKSITYKLPQIKSQQHEVQFFTFSPQTVAPLKVRNVLALRQ